MHQMNVKDARMMFATRAMMLKTIKMNFKNMYKEEGLLCECGEPDTQGHLLDCPQYLQLKEGLNLQTDQGIVAFFQLVIRQREKEDC